jgi:hypothetical protein
MSGLYANDVLRLDLLRQRVETMVIRCSAANKIAKKPGNDESARASFEDYPGTPRHLQEKNCPIV